MPIWPINLSFLKLPPLKIALILMVLILPSACDLSWILGHTGTSTPPQSSAQGGGSNGSSSGPSLISSFAFLTSNNPSLTTNEVATINPPNVNIVVPYNVIQNQTALTPTAVVQSGYTLTSPSGAFYPANGTTLVITNNTNQSISNYTLNVSVDPGSIAFLQLAAPFYWNTSGAKVSLTSAQYALSLAGATNTYTLQFQTDAFQVPYNVNVVQAIINAQAIGFGTATVPYGSFTTNLANATGGAVCPYTITVQSPQKTVTNTFTVQATRTKSNIAQLTDVSATIGYIYNVSSTQAYSDNTLQNFLNASWQEGANDSYLSWYSNNSNTLGATAADFATDWALVPGAPVYPSNSQVYTTTGASWSGSWNPYGVAIPVTDWITTTGGQVNANNAAINSILAAAVNSVVVQGRTTIDLGTSYTISSQVTEPAVQSVVTHLSPTINLNSGLQWGEYLTIYSESFWCYTACTDSQTLTVPVTQTTAYTATAYPQFQQIVIKVPLYNAIIQIAPSTLVQSWNQSQNATDTILTFNMVITTSHVTGVVAQLQIAAETGTVTTYSLAIN